MALRAVWKGFLKFGAVTCAIKLINVASESEKIHFRILNRKDRLPVRSAYIDEITGDVVDGENQIKGYQLENGDYLLIEPDEIKKLDAYFKRIFRNPTMQVKARPRKTDSAEVYVGDEFLGLVFKDEEDGDYNFSMAILDIDLN